MTEEKKINSQYWRFKGQVAWAKIYEPDTFRGASNWLLNFYPENETEWANIKKAGLQARVKEDDGEKSGVKGKFIPLRRPVVKQIKGNPVYFTPPRIFDKDGEPIILYTDGQNKEIRSYDDKSLVINRVGSPVLIGNGSTVYVNVVVYPTEMGPGNRLESIQILDLVEYEKNEGPVVNGSGDEELPF